MLMIKPKAGRKGMVKNVCDLCGYVYDSTEGDSANNIKPGTAFESLPADWVCPLCGAAKDKFYTVKE
jgi:rubredoxin